MLDIFNHLGHIAAHSAKALRCILNHIILHLVRLLPTALRHRMPHWFRQKVLQESLQYSRFLFCFLLQDYESGPLQLQTLFRLRPLLHFQGGI